MTMFSSSSVRLSRLGFNILTKTANVVKTTTSVGQSQLKCTSLAPAVVSRFFSNGPQTPLELEPTKQHPHPRMHGTKEEYLEWIRVATSDRGSKEYLELYNYANQCFTEADTNKDGSIQENEFEGIIARIAFLSLRYGMAPDEDGLLGKTAQERTTGRKKLFKSIDTNGDGHIDFSEFLDYSVRHLRQKLQLSKPMTSEPEQKERLHMEEP